MPNVNKRLSNTEIAAAIRDAQPQDWHQFRSAVSGKGMTRTEVGQAWRVFRGVYTDEKFQEFHSTSKDPEVAKMDVDKSEKSVPNPDKVSAKGKVAKKLADQPRARQVAKAKAKKEQRDAELKANRLKAELERKAVEAELDEYEEEETKEEDEQEETKEEEEEENEETFTGDAVFDAISEMYKKYVDEAGPDEMLKTSGQFEQAMEDGIKKAREDAVNDGQAFNSRDEEIAFALDWLNKTFADKAPKQEPAPAQAPEQAGQAEKPASVPNHGRFDKRVPAKDKVTEKIGGQPRERQDARAKAVRKQKQAQFIANRMKAGNSQAPEGGGPADGGAADGVPAGGAQAANAPVVGGPQVVEGQPLPPVEYTEPVTDSYVTEGLSRDGPMTAQHAVEMDKEDGEGKSTDRLKDEIRAMHLVYNHKVKEFLDKNHQSAMHRALLSHDADTVRGHHRGMLEAVAKYYASGKGNGMRIGVVVSAEQYLAKFGGGGGGAAAGGGGGTNPANPHHVQQVHSYRKGENPFSQAVDMQSFYQRGGMSSYKQHAVYGHKLPPPNETRPFQVHDPLARVDMPLQHALQRPITQVGFGSQYKLKSSKELTAVYD